MGYCIYTGASAILEDAKCGKGTANEILRTYLRALNAGMKNCPLLERSLNIIVKGLNRFPAPPPSDPPDHRSHMNTQVNTMGFNNYIPAFPYLGNDTTTGFDFNGYFGEQHMGSMAMLDSFPESQMNMGELLWPPAT